jgi:hypothetical protein
VGADCASAAAAAARCRCRRRLKLHVKETFEFPDGASLLARDTWQRHRLWALSCARAAQAATHRFFSAARRSHAHARARTLLHRCRAVALHAAVRAGARGVPHRQRASVQRADTRSPRFCVVCVRRRLLLR